MEKEKIWYNPEKKMEENKWIKLNLYCKNPADKELIELGIETEPELRPLYLLRSVIVGLYPSGEKGSYIIVKNEEDNYWVNEKIDDLVKQLNIE